MRAWVCLAFLCLASLLPLSTARGVKMSVLYETDCAFEQSFAGQACRAVADATVKYPNEVIEAHQVSMPECPGWVAANAAEHKLIVMLGFLYADCSVEAARNYPSVWVVVLDDCPPEVQTLDNLVCALFAEEEPAFISGYLAGLLSETKVTGVVAGSPVPPVQKMFNAFLLGVRNSCPQCRVEGAYVSSFFHPVNGRAVASYLVQNLSADVLFGCGGATGSQAILLAAGLGAKVIGVDVDEFGTTFANQSQDLTRMIITSVLKRVHVGVGTIITLMRQLNVTQEIPGVRSSKIIFDYTNSGVGVADCHLACDQIGSSMWSLMKAKENELANRVTAVGLGVAGYEVPLFPKEALPNVLYTAPDVSLSPTPRFQAAMTSFNAWLVDYVVLFGGKSTTGEILGDLWLYNPQGGRWLEANHGMTVGPQPPGLAKACAVSMGSEVVIFGGRTAQGEQSGAVYSFKYQDSFLGFAEPASPLIRQEWIHRAGIGELPLPVEGPSCTSFNSTCALVFGGRARLTLVNSVHLLCLQGSEVHWHEIALAGQSGPSTREGAGAAYVEAEAVGLPSTAPNVLVIVGGSQGSRQSARRDVWLLSDPLGSAPTWEQLPDLPQAVEFPLVFSPLQEGLARLAVQTSSSLDDTGFDAFVFDPVRNAWNTQETGFEVPARGSTVQASLAVGILNHEAGTPHLWLFGGNLDAQAQANLTVSRFKVLPKCEPGEESQGAGCERCGPGRFSRGGVAAVCLNCTGGMFVNVTGASECSNCPAGRYGDAKGQSACPLCPRGRFKLEGNRPCEECAFGTYGEEAGALRPGDCKACAEGKYNGNRGSTSEEDCLPCEAGRFLAYPQGEPSCTLCPSGKFSVPQQPECAYCGKGSYQPAEGQTACKNCELMDSTTDVQGAVKASDCVCKKDYFRQTNSSIRCLPCPKGLECDLDSDMSRPGAFPNSMRLLRGYWASTESPLLAFQCQPQELCPGGAPATCANSQTIGRACAQCEDRYYITALGCQECSALEILNLVFPATPVIACPVIICLMYHFFRDLPERWESWQNTLSTVAFIGLNHYQVIALLESVNAGLPASVSKVFNVWGVTQDAISVFNVECAGFGGFMERTLVRSLTPCFLLVMCGLVYATSHVVARLSKQPLGMDLDRLMNVFFSIVYAFFTGIANLSLALFKCDENPSGKWTLVHDRSTLCYEDTWLSVLGIAVASVLVYCVGCVMLFTYLIIIAPKKFTDVAFQKRWKFLFIKYRPNVHWWSIVVLIKGVLLNIGTVALTLPIAKLYWMLVLMLAYVGSAAYKFPWRRRATSLLDIFVHLLAVVVVAGTSTLSVLPDNTNLATFVVVTSYVPLVFCFLAGFLVCLPNMGWRCAQGYSKCEWDTAELLFAVSSVIVCLPKNDRLLMVRAIGGHDQGHLADALLAMQAELTAGRRGGMRLVTGEAERRITRGQSWHLMRSLSALQVHSITAGGSLKTKEEDPGLKCEVTSENEVCHVVV